MLPALTAGQVVDALTAILDACPDLADEPLEIRTDDDTEFRVLYATADGGLALVVR